MKCDSRAHFWPVPLQAFALVASLEARVVIANVFNLVSKGVIFQEFCATCGDIIQLIFLNCEFYAFEYFLFYNHYSCEGDVTITPFAMGICQGDPLKGALFALPHFNAPCFIISHFPSYLFPSIEYDIHIISPLSIAS
jgi:hypothetical protein